MRKIKKTVVMILCVAILGVSIPMSEVGVQASTSRTQAEAVSWINAAVGKSWDWDGAYGYQCVDLIRYYYQFLGASSPGGNAVAYASNALPSGWTRIPYSSGFVAQPGDIAVWKGPTVYGHVALVVSATSTNMSIVEQNHDGSGTLPANTYTYRYNNNMSFYGVIRPDFQSEINVTYSSISSGTYFIKNNSTGTYLNVDGGVDTNKQNVSVAAYTGGASMQMAISGASRGYKIRPLCSSSRLINPFAVTVSSGINVNLYNDDSDSSQWWGFESVSGGYVIRNMQNQNCVLSLSGTNVIVSTYTGAANQVWSLEPYNTYTISYNANGGSGAPSAQTKTYGKTLTLSSTIPSRDGYAFLGWSTSSSGTGATYQAGGSYTVNASVTLYAVWQKNSYTTCFDANGGSDTTYAVRQAGENIVFPDYAPSRRYYVFLGWADTATSTTAQYELGDSIVASNGNKTFYAVWEAPTVMEDGREYTVDFTKNNVEKYFAFKPTADGYYMVDKDFLHSCGDFLWCENNGSHSFEDGLKYLEKDRTYYFEATSYNYDWYDEEEKGDGTLSITYTPITHMEARATHSVLPSQDRRYYWYDIKPIYTLYAGNDIYFTGDSSEFNANTNLGRLDDNLYDITVWNVGTQIVEVYLGELTCQMEVIVEEGNVVSIEPIGKNILIENYDGYLATDYDTHEQYFEYSLWYAPFQFVATYSNGYSETLDYWADSFNVMDPQSSENAWGVGTHTVICEYQGLSAEFTVEVVENPVASIKVLTDTLAITENTCGAYSAYSKQFIYSIEEVVYEHPVKLYVLYTDGTDEVITITESTETIEIDGNITGVEADNYLELSLWGNSARIEVEIVDNPELDLIVSARVIEIPEYSVYPIGSMYDCNGVKIEVTMESGATETFVIKGIFGTAELSQYNCDYSAWNNISEGVNEVVVDFLGWEIPITTVVGTAQVESFEFLTMPDKMDGTGALMKIYFADGTSQEVNILSVEEMQGATNSWMFTQMQTDKGFYFGAKYKAGIGASGHMEMRYGWGPGNINSEDGTWVDLDDNLIRAKILVLVASEYFDTTETFSGEQTKDNINDIVMVATLYYYYEYDPEVAKELEVDDFSVQVQKMFAIENLDLTKSRFYNASQNILFVSERCGEFGLGDLFSNAIQVYRDKEDSWVFRYTRDEDVNYFEVKKSTNQILYIGKTYEDVTPIGISVVEKPNKTNYYVGENIDSSGLQIQLNYGDGTTKIVTQGFTVSGYQPYQLGEQTIIVNYEGFTTAFNVTVETQVIPLQSITVVTNPIKTNYIVGQALDTTGLTLRLDYTDGTSEVVTEGFEVAGFETETIGVHAIEISYDGITTTFNVEVTEAEITLSTNEQTLVIGGTIKLDVETQPEGSVVTWTTSDDGIATVADGVVTGVHTGNAIITAQFEYEGEVYKATCVVTIIPSLESMEILTMPTKIIYNVGEELDTTGLTFQLNYDDGTTKIIEDNYDIYGFDNQTVGTQTVYVVYQGNATSFSVVVNEIIDETSPQIVVDSKRAVVGQTVTVAIAIKNNPGIASMCLTVSYDNNALELASVTDSGKLGEALHSDVLNAVPYTLCWMNSTITENITYNGQIVVLTFNVLETAPLGDTRITVSYDYNNDDILDCDMQQVKFSMVNGTVAISDVLLGDVNNDGKVNLRDGMELQRYIAKWDGYTEDTINMAAADVNADGKVNLKDGMILQRHIAQWNGYAELPYTE